MLGSYHYSKPLASNLWGDKGKDGTDLTYEHRHRSAGEPKAKLAKDPFKKLSFSLDAPTLCPKTRWKVYRNIFEDREQRKRRRGRGREGDSFAGEGTAWSFLGATGKLFILGIGREHNFRTNVRSQRQAVPAVPCEMQVTTLAGLSLFLSYVRQRFLWNNAGSSPIACSIITNHGTQRHVTHPSLFHFVPTSLSCDAMPPFIVSNEEHRGKHISSMYNSSWSNASIQFHPTYKMSSSNSCQTR